MRALSRQQPGDPVRQRARLARAGAREDQQWPLAKSDRLALRPVQARKQALDLVGARLDGPSAGLALYLLFDVGDGPRIVLAPARSDDARVRDSATRFRQLSRSERRSRTGP
jgi:hypothetical protein